MNAKIITSKNDCVLPVFCVVIILSFVFGLTGCGPAAETSGDKAPSTGVQKEGYFQTHVYFATDRKPEHNDDLRFSGMRGDGNLIYGMVEVSIPDSHKVGAIESPRWFRFWDRDDPSEFVLVLSRSRFDDRLAFGAHITELLKEVGRDDVLVFIHGYNVNFDEAAKRTAQLAYDLEFTGASMFYSWPSLGQFDKYPTDKESVEWTIPHLQNFLRFTLTNCGAKNVHIIAHSMGNKAIVDALCAFDPSTLPSGSAKLRQIILAAPDIAADNFKQLAANFNGKAKRVTLYTSKNDKAMIASMKFQTYPRAGGCVVVVDGVDTIDAAEVETGFFAHAYYGSSIMPDIFALIQNDLPPTNRFGLKRISDEKGIYWKVKPGAFNRDE
ncbi:alpha/beta hydrolase [Verrucomicrobiota bacterium]